ncbi:Glutamine amidotransferase [Dillenia turbinata]|uniref:Glutamine amidotransferase n=1 Tax=Dillenia turbinata TaxID=194707 RepID=A0AAN8W453_9MAGN
MGEKRFAVLLCAEDSEYMKNKYGGYFGVFVGMLAEEGETWDVFKVALGEFPEDEEIEEFDGFVITGSCADAHGNDMWILKLLNLLKKLVSLKKKVLGICFGHQILGRALGGKIGHHIMGIQGHPEYTKDILSHLIDRLIQRNLIKDTYGKKVRTQVEEREPDKEAWKTLCTSFLKGGL